MAGLGQKKAVRFVMSASEIEIDFPLLRIGQNYSIDSAETLEYNCLAWTVYSTVHSWDPEEVCGGYWPPGVPKQNTVATWVAALQTQMYATCEDGKREQGFEKVAIFANADGEPTHAARQLQDGRWTSKLGDGHDITHADLVCLEGNYYGSVVQYLKRRRKEWT
jgi:hypothetical protein